MPTKAGFMVGLRTHEVARVGSLIWVATPTFDEQPTLEQVAQIIDWRWPILFPLTSAIRQRIVSPVGELPIPEPLRAFPTLRGGERKIGWVAFTEVDGSRRNLGPTTDRSLPIYQVVNAAALEKKVITGWRPEDDY